MNNDVAIYRAYVDDPQNDCCELARYLGIAWRNGKYTPLMIGVVIEPDGGAHHILSQGLRPHKLSNLIRISREAHRLVHNGTHREPQIIRVACIAAKIIKRNRLGEPAEFDLKEMYDTFSMHMAGVVGKYTFTEDWHRELQARCLRLIEDLAREGSLER